MKNQILKLGALLVLFSFVSLLANTKASVGFWGQTKANLGKTKDDNPLSSARSVDYDSSYIKFNVNKDNVEGSISVHFDQEKVSFDKASLKVSNLLDGMLDLTFFDWDKKTGNTEANDRYIIRGGGKKTDGKGIFAMVKPTELVHFGLGYGWRDDRIHTVKGHIALNLGDIGHTDIYMGAFLRDGSLPQTLKTQKFGKTMAVAYVDSEGKTLRSNPYNTKSVDVAIDDTVKSAQQPGINFDKTGTYVTTSKPKDDLEDSMLEIASLGFESKLWGEVVKLGLGFVLPMGNRARYIEVAGTDEKPTYEIKPESTLSTALFGKYTMDDFSLKYTFQFATDTVSKTDVIDAGSDEMLSVVLKPAYTFGKFTVDAGIRFDQIGPNNSTYFGKAPAKGKSHMIYQTTADCDHPLKFSGAKGPFKERTAYNVFKVDPGFKYTPIENLYTEFTYSFKTKLGELYDATGNKLEGNDGN